MREIKVYEAEDGKKFDTFTECLNYEKYVHQLEKIMAQLPKRPDDCNFSNGHGYIQHDKDTIDRVMKELLKTIPCVQDYPGLPEILSNPFECRDGYIGGTISEGDNVANHHWYRFVCMSNNYKEYGQPYYAYHESEAKQICLNN